MDAINKRGIVQNLTFKDVLWCLTVPATYDQDSRAAMERIAAMAGLIRSVAGVDNGGSPHPLKIVLEPEASSVWILNHFNRSDLTITAKLFALEFLEDYNSTSCFSANLERLTWFILLFDVYIIRAHVSMSQVVDAGGGTVDLVVHRRNNNTIREVVPGTGDLCGGMIMFLVYFYSVH